MNEDWGTAIDFVLKQEGGYTLDPNDPGGETNFGISHKAYPHVDIANLTIDQAKDIYLKDYWQACQCDQLPRPFAISVFDTAVNQGTGVAARLLQISLGVQVDGVIGSKTIAAAFKADPHKIKKFLAERLAAYSRLMAANTNLLVYAVNWSYRVISLTELVLKLDANK